MSAHSRRPLQCLVSLLWLVMVTSASATAQERTPPLTLDDAVERALHAYPSVQVAEADQRGARAGLREAEATRRPRLDLVNVTTRYQKDTVVSPIHGFTPGQTPPFDQTLFRTALDGSYVLYDGGRNRARVEQARSESEAVDSTLSDARIRVTARVVESYARILSHQQVLSAHDRRIVALESEQARVATLLEVGRASRLDALRVSAALAEATAERVRLDEALDVATRELARVIGARPDEIRPEQLVPFGLSPAGALDVDRLVDIASRANPAIQQARRRLSAADAAVDLAVSDSRPQLRLAGSIINFGSGGGNFTNEWSAGLQVTYPLLDGGTTRERAAKAIAARDGTAARLALLLTELEGEIDRARSTVREAVIRRESLLPVVAQFEEITRIERARLVAGAGTLTDFLNAEADLLAARANLIEAAYAELTSRVELARIAGDLSPDWLRQHARAMP